MGDRKIAHEPDRVGSEDWGMVVVNGGMMRSDWSKSEKSGENTGLFSAFADQGFIAPEKPPPSLGPG
jgi:hypothetical protein